MVELAASSTSALLTLAHIPAQLSRDRSMLHFAELMGSSIPVHQNNVKGALPVTFASAASASAALAFRHHLNKVIEKHELTPKNV